MRQPVKKQTAYELPNHHGVYIKPVNPADSTLPANPEQIKIVVAMTG